VVAAAADRAVVVGAVGGAVAGLGDEGRALGHVVQAGVLAVAVAGARVGEGGARVGQVEGARVRARVDRLGQLEPRQPVVGEGAGDHVAVVGGEGVAGAALGALAAVVAAAADRAVVVGAVGGAVAGLGDEGRALDRKSVV